MKIENVCILLAQLLLLATFAQQASAGGVDSDSLSVSTNIPGVIIVELPSKTEIRNYEPDLDSTGIGTVTLKTNCPNWIMASYNLDGDEGYLFDETFKKNHGSRLRVKVGSNEKVTLGEEPMLVSGGGIGINPKEDLVISQRGSWADNVGTDYGITVVLVASPTV